MYQVSTKSNKIYFLLRLSKNLQCAFDKRDKNLDFISKIMIFHGAPVYQISSGSERKIFCICLSLGADNSVDKRQIWLILTYFLLLIFCSTSVQIFRFVGPKRRFDCTLTGPPQHNCPIINNCNNSNKHRNQTTTTTTTSTCNSKFIRFLWS